MNREEPAFKIKNATIPWFVIHIHTTDIGRLKSELAERMAQAPDFFANTPMVLGLTPIAESDETLDMVDLVAFMRQQNIQAAGVIGGSEAQRQSAIEAGLGLFPELAEKMPVRKVSSQPEATPVAESAPAPVSEPVEPEYVLRPTMVIDKPVRTGQRIYAEHANLVVLAVVNAGAELIADGNIHVYAPLRGRAIAGAHGNPEARIFISQMEAELVSIDGVFQVFDGGIPDDLRGKDVQISQDGDKLIFKKLMG